MALSAKTDRKEKEGKLVDHPMAVDVIYAGALCKHNAAGFLAPCAAEDGAVFAGVAVETVDNSAGSAGDKSARVDKKGNFLMNGSGFSQSDVGAAVFASDDNTVSTSQGSNEQQVGRIVEFISATEVRVKIDLDAI